jgi:type IV secretion system protein VirD4
MEKKKKTNVDENGIRKTPWKSIAVGSILSQIAGYYLAAGAATGANVMIWYQNMQNVLKMPFHNYWDKYSIFVMIFCFFVYALFITCVMASRKNFMFGKEYGSSKFETLKYVNFKLADHDPENCISIVKQKKHRKNV